jgi:hypothetical protein
VSHWKLQETLEAVIELLLRSHPQGLRVLVGEIPAPTFEDLLMMLHREGVPVSEVRVSGGKATAEQESCLIRAEMIQDAVDRCGGWEVLVEMAKAYKEACPSSWKIFLDHIVWVESGGISRLAGEAQLSRIAEKHGVSPDTVQRRRHEVVTSIARGALLIPKGELELLPSD